MFNKVLIKFLSIKECLKPQHYNESIEEIYKEYPNKFEVPRIEKVCHINFLVTSL